MNDGLPTFREGFSIAPQLTARAMNSIVAAIRRNRITPGPNQLLSQDGGGTQVWDRRRRAQISISVPQPFKISNASEGSTAKVTVALGDVDDGFTGGIVPKIGGVFISAATAPKLTVVTGSVYLDCTMDAAGQFTAVDIGNAASLPSNTSTHRYRQLGLVTVTAGTTASVAVASPQTVTTSVSHKLCGGLSTWGRT